MLDSSPVIVGVGEVLDRPADLQKSREPAVLMADAVRRAEEDAGARMIPHIDAIDVVKEVSIPYPDLPGRVTNELGLNGRSRAALTDGSGNGPLREMHNAAIRIQRGEIEVALLCGAEAQWSVDQARKRDEKLPWAPPEQLPELFRPLPYANALALKYGLVTPAQVYPLYENATTSCWGQTSAAARQESAEIWSRMSRVAAGNPGAWLPKFHRPDEIARPTSFNRSLAWPYLKLMVAQPSVNLGAAVLMTSVGKARALGVPAERMIFIRGGAAAREPDDYILRDRYDANASQTAVLQSVLDLMGWTHSEFDCVELYSCFPVVPKMARRLLGLAIDAPLTVAGGLTFFGAPVHNYMSHAVAAMTRRLRRRGGAYGLLYGQGGFVTKHHGLILSDVAPEAPISETPSVQAKADSLRGKTPELVDDYVGPAILETFTVLHGRDGAPLAGVALAKTPNSARALATVPASDTAVLERLESMDRSPIGIAISLESTEDGRIRCVLAN